MKKLITAALATLALTGCVATYPNEYEQPQVAVAVEVAPLYVQPAFVYYNGMYGFWWGTGFYPQNYYCYGFHGYYNGAYVHPHYYQPHYGYNQRPAPAPYYHGNQQQHPAPYHPAPVPHYHNNVAPAPHIAAPRPAPYRVTP